MIISFLLLGDHGTHKTISVTSLNPKIFETPIQYLYSHEMSDSENDTQKINIWDIPSTVRDLKKFVILQKVNLCLIFCHLNHTTTCESVPSWYSLIQRLRPGIQIVLIAYMERDTEKTKRNQEWLLNWCRNEIHQDLPYFRVQQDQEFPVVYQQLTNYMKEKLKTVTYHGLPN